MKVLLTTFLCLGLHGFAQTVDLEPPLEISMAMEARVSVARGAAYLLATQGENGQWSHHPGITAACVAALVEAPQQDKSSVAVDRGLASLRQQVRADGTIGLRPKEVDVYATSIALIAFVLADRQQDIPLVARMIEGLRDNQLPHGLSYAPGGFRYAADQYPDLSNTHWALEALYLAANRQPELVGDPQAQARLWGTSRKLILSCQLPADAADGQAGGFTYYPVDSPLTPRHEAELAGARVWGSLTYGGAKSLLYTGMQPDAKPVVAACEWLSRHYTVNQNPGLGEGGRFYYLYMMVTTRTLLGKPAGDRSRNWRLDTVDHLLSVQRGDGSWRNRNQLWMENDPNLCTAYALLAMAIILSE